MSQFFSIHPQTPQLRLVRRSVAILRTGGVVAYPTDSCYALGCLVGDKAAMQRIRVIRGAGPRHNFTLVCRDLSEIAIYARVDNATFRLLKAHTPGAYTFILRATHEVPKRLQHPKRKTIGIRIPQHPITQAILTELREPIMSSTLMLAGEIQPLTDPEEMRRRLEHQVDLVIDGGSCGVEPTTVVDLSDDVPVVIRIGRGNPAPFSRVH
ncbi:MAG TPA: L-threonylcarbamoyladenylate synthase [Gammaproteobacteria bacterium]|nr:L-threonylcarbamoyladenylate synthase [Gammaproteobacteria bacterium]